jgi:hypothetical protein
MRKRSVNIPKVLNLLHQFLSSGDPHAVYTLGMGNQYDTSFPKNLTKAIKLIRLVAKVNVSKHILFDFVVSKENFSHGF